MTTDIKNNPTPDEKMMAALAHFFGPLAAIIVWAIQKDKSHFTKYQALQALSFDFLVMIFMGVLFACGFGIIFPVMFGLIFASAGNPGASNESLAIAVPMLFPFMIFACIFPFSLVLTLARMVAAISVLSGKDFRYPVIGKWLENFLAQ